MVLSADGRFEAQVNVDSAACYEHTPVVGAPSCDAFVETNFFMPSSFQMTTTESDPYGETFEQRWPVTPFTLSLTNHTEQRVWARVYIDGEAAFGGCVKSEECREVEGIQAKPGRGQSEQRAMLFSRPRPLKRGETLGSESTQELESRSTRRRRRSGADAPPSGLGARRFAAQTTARPRRRAARWLVRAP